MSDDLVSFLMADVSDCLAMGELRQAGDKSISSAGDKGAVLFILPERSGVDDTLLNELSVLSVLSSMLGETFFAGERR